MYMASCLVLGFLFFSHVAVAQTISTNTPVPPLQWINLTGLLQGTARPPPLKDAVMGYDETSRSIIIFGGESENGFAQGQTYLLNLDNLSWTVPSPPSGLQRTPPARSAALAGEDFAASNRHAFVVVGGKGSDRRALSDVWAFDFINQFWSPVFLSPGGPSPRWSASGGLDTRLPPVQDSVVPGPNNTLYLAGGSNEDQSYPLSEIWRLHLSGTLSSNLPNSSMGSWERLSIGSFPVRVDQGTTMVGSQIVTVGGCDSTRTNPSCAQGGSFVVNVERQSSISPGGCPAPRLGPALAPNRNTISSSYASQVHMLLGTFDEPRWNDDGGLQNGEVDVLDVNTGTWTRLLPSGDPGQSGRESFPTPREGSSVFSYQMGLVGPNRNGSADTIVFGGRDASGKYLSEVWLLRSYNGVITSSGTQWSGFGDGRLQTGVSADGRGVKVQYLSRCASAVSTSTSGTSSPVPTETTGGNSGGNSGNPSITIHSYDTSLIHKLLSTLSVIILEAVFLLWRYEPSRTLSYPFFFIFTAIGTAAYGLGVAGFALSFTTIVEGSAIQARSISSLHLRTGHGVAGLVLCVCFYGLIPLWALLRIATKRLKRPFSRANVQENANVANGEKPNQPSSHARSAPQSLSNISPPSSPRPRTQSQPWNPSPFWRRSLDNSAPSDTDSIRSGGQRTSTFEVLNRPSKPRRMSGTLTSSLPPVDTPPPLTRSLGEIDWLLRRRSLNLVGELDYAIAQAQNAPMSTPGTADILLAPPDPVSLSQPAAVMPSLSDAFFHAFVHTSLLALNVLILVALWERARKIFFILFLIWTFAFYVALLSLAWTYHPHVSIISTIFFRLRNSPDMIPEKSPPQSPSTARQTSFQNSGPYIHQPPYRMAADEYSISHAAPRSVEADDDDIDEVTRQRMIEQEMDRRDVSIITVPKRRLWVANPS